jgi:hypothetical protein
MSDCSLVIIAVWGRNHIVSFLGVNGAAVAHLALLSPRPRGHSWDEILAAWLARIVTVRTPAVLPCLFLAANPDFTEWLVLAQEPRPIF